MIFAGVCREVNHENAPGCKMTQDVSKLEIPQMRGLSLIKRILGRSATTSNSALSP